MCPKAAFVLAMHCDETAIDDCVVVVLNTYIREHTHIQV